MEIQTVALEEINKSSVNGNIPVLVDIPVDGLDWTALGQTDSALENGHLRLVSDVYRVVYQGKTYLPCNMSYQDGSEDGKTKGNASIKITALDARVVEMIRSINQPVAMSIIASFMKVTQGDDVSISFYPLSGHTYWSESTNWNKTQASFPLIFDRTMSLNAPRDTATAYRCPSINSDE